MGVHTMFRISFITVAVALLLGFAVLHPSPAQGEDAGHHLYLDELHVVLGGNDADPDVYMRQIEEVLGNAEVATADRIGGEMISQLGAARAEDTAIGHHAGVNGWLVTLSFLRDLYFVTLMP